MRVRISSLYIETWHYFQIGLQSLCYSDSVANISILLLSNVHLADFLTCVFSGYTLLACCIRLQFISFFSCFQIIIMYCFNLSLFLIRCLGVIMLRSFMLLYMFILWLFLNILWASCFWFVRIRDCYLLHLLQGFICKCLGFDERIPMLNNSIFNW